MFWEGQEVIPVRVNLTEPTACPQPNSGCWESPCHFRMGLGIEGGKHIQRPITYVLWLVELLRALLAFGVGLVLGAATRVCLPTLS